MISSSFFWRETCIFANCTATLHWGTPPSPGSLLFGWFQDPGGRDFNETLGTKFNKDLLPGVSLESRLTKEIKIEILGSPDSPVFPATFASDGDSCLLPWTLVWHLWGLLRKKIEILAVVIILNPISSVCSHGSWDRTTQKKIPPRGGGGIWTINMIGQIDTTMRWRSCINICDCQRVLVPITNRPCAALFSGTRTTFGIQMLAICWSRAPPRVVVFHKRALSYREISAKTPPTWPGAWKCTSLVSLA